MKTSAAGLRTTLRRIALAASLGAATPAGARELAQVPFWQASQGWWTSENTYLSPTMDYNIRSYASIVHIVIEGRRIVETEYKFYPAGKMAKLMGGPTVHDGDGIEHITVTTYERTDDAGTVRQIAVEPELAPANTVTTIRVFDGDTAEKIIRDPAEPYDHYRMFITMPTPARRYLVNYGLVSTEGGSGSMEAGALRGFATFHGRRIAPGDVEQLRAELRQRFSVKVRVTAGPDHRPRATRLD